MLTQFLVTLDEWLFSVEAILQLLRDLLGA
ncbi:MAG: hypothetical protein RL227_1366 [Pseudomonadota bacterium]|jgi:hypothetical protein